MAKAVADVTGEKQGGFASDNTKIQGFSHMHDLGVGWMPSLGNFPIMPFNGCPQDDVARCLLFKSNRPVASVPGSIKARPGYFAIALDSGIKTEVTVTEHTSLYRFRFEPPEEPGTNASPLIMAYVEDLQGSQRSTNIEVDPATGRITGNATFTPSFGPGSYTTFFCTDFAGASLRDAGLFHNSGDVSTVTGREGGNHAGAWSRFTAASEVLVRVGVSFINNEQACRNAEKEVPDFEFGKVLRAAEKLWEKKLSVVELDAGAASEEMLTVFWTGIYRTFLSPQDYTGENPLWKSDEPYFDSWYCIWDTFRTTHPLLTLLDPAAQTRMVRSLIDIYRNEGHMPDCRMSLSKGYTQGGSNADIVVVDGIVKGLTDGVDLNDAWKAVVADAEKDPQNWLVAGRGANDQWRELGYIPSNNRGARSVSRSVEYAYNDFVIAEMAVLLGYDKEAETYLSRSKSWEKLFKSDVPSFVGFSATSNGTDTGFSGFLQPRKSDGSWDSQDPIFCSPLHEFHACYFDTIHSTYEGSLWLYTFLASPGNMASLIPALGGPQSFVDRLDYFHDSGILDIGDEQSFLTVFMYHYAGRPALSTKRLHAYIPSAFNTSVNGLPGNDDSGAMGAFASLGMAGLFPNAGQDVYFITPPFFRQVTIKHQKTGKTATVRNINFDPSYRNIYIQSASLNGRPWTKNWLRHDFFVDGGILELVLGSKESDWGTKKEDLPPSADDVVFLKKFL